MTIATAPTAGRGQALAAAALVGVGGMLPVSLTGALAVQLRSELGMGEATLGLAVAVFFTAGALTAVSAGRLADRLGWRAAVAGNSVLSAVSLAGAAFVAGHPAVLIAFLGIGGVAMAGAMSAGNLVLAREGPVQRLGLYLGLKQTAVPVATLLAGAAVPAVALTLGWRWAFGLALVVPAATWVASRRGAAQARADRVTVAAPARGTRGPVPTTLKVLATACAFASVVPGVLAGFVVVSAVGIGIGEAAAGGLLVAGSLLGLGVRVWMGWRIDRVHSDGFREVAILLCIGAAGLALMATRQPPAFVAGSLLAFAAGWGWPGLFFYGVVSAHMETPAAATGVIQSGGATGTAVGPLLFGLVAGSLGHGAAWAASAGLAVLAGGLTWGAAIRASRPAVVQEVHRDR